MTKKLIEGSWHKTKLVLWGKDSVLTHNSGVPALIHVTIPLIVASVRYLGEDSRSCFVNVQIFVASQAQHKISTVFSVALAIPFLQFL